MPSFRKGQQCENEPHSSSCMAQQAWFLLHAFFPIVMFAKPPMDGDNYSANCYPCSEQDNKIHWMFDFSGSGMLVASKCRFEGVKKNHL